MKKLHNYTLNQSKLNFLVMCHKNINVINPQATSTNKRLAYPLSPDFHSLDGFFPFHLLQNIFCATTL